MYADQHGARGGQHDIPDFNRVHRQGMRGRPKLNSDTASERTDAGVEGVRLELGDTQGLGLNAWERPEPSLDMATKMNSDAGNVFDKMLSPKA